MFKTDTEDKKSLLKERYTIERLNILKSFLNQTDEKDILNSLNLDGESIELLLKKIFDISRLIGLDLRKEYYSDKKADPDIKEISSILSFLSIPCLKGSWDINENSGSFIIKRNNCIYKDNPTTCLYWREAIDGLIMGLGDSERYTRHKSKYFSKDDECVDVVYDSNKSNLRWADVPETIIKKLSCIIEKLNKKQIELILVGYTEKTLYYKIKDSNENLSQFRRGFIIKTISTYCFEKLPEIKAVEISPRAVIEGDF